MTYGIPVAVRNIKGHADSGIQTAQRRSDMFAGARQLPGSPIERLHAVSAGGSGAHLPTQLNVR